ncbi:hypothetical protein COT94_01590 [Candidatus Falkowbacteria bacterium CG10_big_fil_rev_8_21_14_0_10_37_14]|uniref:Uncharacterized protein n=1 Tax=Candidatus Falkowbacteria bacterium CG10_big_fil_rev_8_21_14_0_10_37_14 TaxID=1974561 RepID=A0A2M6WTW2_9BACT|nr:hypothetical protein [Candidatus Falkowbacteria bacterium]PIT96217.1 MAG: hypothetical protein COT94_01590 [Candidatus Falkowbacteria bacterium CG10_big_fil_rev_8_21_14_0_10_37_14]
MSDNPINKTLSNTIPTPPVLVEAVQTAPVDPAPSVVSIPKPNENINEVVSDTDKVKPIIQTTVGDQNKNQFVPSPAVEPQAPVLDDKPLASAPEKLSNGANFLNRKIKDDVSPYSQSKDEFAQAVGGSLLGSDTAKENIDIYVMPKEFQHNKISGGSTSGGLIVIIIAILLLGASWITIYLYFVNPDLLRQYIGAASSGESKAPVAVVNINDVAVTPPSSLETVTTTIATLPSELPKDVYLKYSQSLNNLDRWQDYINLLGTYGSDLMVQKAEAQKLSASTEEQGKLLQDLKNTPILLGTENFQEVINNDKAVLSIVLIDQSVTGTINLVLEKNAWKISEEQWFWPDPIVTGSINYAVADDRDIDGLTDYEETIFDTSKDNVDSDGDGYNDGTEVINLYNPTGKDQLTGSPRIKQYKREEYLLSVLVPSQWLVDFKPQGSVGVVSFTAEDNQRFLIDIMSNDKKLSADAYYLEVSGAKDIRPEQRRTGVDWSGVLSEDGLAAYVVGKDGKFTYHLSYDPAADSMLKYPHLFTVLVKSLVVK